MKNKLIIISVLAAINAAFASYANSKNIKDDVTSSEIKQTLEIAEEKIKAVFDKQQQYEGSELLILLVQIEKSLQTKNLDQLNQQAENISDFIDFYKKEAKKRQQENVVSDLNYMGQKVVELEYGNWLNSKILLVPFEEKLREKMLLQNFTKKDLSNFFAENEINEAKVRYISYNLDNKELRLDLYKLITNIEEYDFKAAHKTVNRIYDEILINHESKASMALKIRDHLTVAKYLMDYGQIRAAKNTIKITDSLMLRLIEAMSDSPQEQQKVRDLRSELENIEKVSDKNYHSKWEKLSIEIENWWKNK